MQQLVLTNIPMDLSNFVITFNTLHGKRIGQHALYILNSVLFANLYCSHGKRLRKNTLNKEQTFYF